MGRCEPRKICSLPRHPKFSLEVNCDPNEASFDGCACGTLFIFEHGGQQGAAIPRECVSGDALAHDWSHSRRTNTCILWRTEPAECFLCGGRERRRVEDG